jgi:signal transduction histidine kinase
MALADAAGARVRAVVEVGGVQPIAAGVDLRRIDGLSDALTASTTTGTERAAGVVHLAASGGAVVIVDAVYPPATPIDIAVRRNLASGVVVAIARLDDLLHPDGSAALFAHAAVQIRGPAGDFGTAVHRPVLHSTLRVGNAVWRLDVGNPPGGRPIAGWVILGAGLVLALLTYVVVRRQHDHRLDAEAEADLRSDQLGMIAETSSALQQSLDLAELLPTFCVSIAGQFALRSVAVEIADDARLVEAFHYGDGDDGQSAGSNQFELRRGWRTVGRLTTRAERPLDDLACQSLQALCDLLAVAVSNAHLFQREQQAVSRLSELDALKNAFLGTVSHELRTSTTAVQGFGELLTDHWDTLPDERRRELASRIRRQAGSLRHLVDDLLDYARLEHQSLRVSPRTMSLSDIVRQLSDSMTPLVAGHDIVLEIEDDITAWADPIAVERILANLLSNAGKYSPADTTVTVGVERVGDRARLRVADQGPGIPAEERSRVFVRFYRLSNPETLKTRGAGIGLSILHDFAAHSGAVVTIGDAPGGGALIWVDFPIDAALPTAELAPAMEVRDA